MYAKSFIAVTGLALVATAATGAETMVKRGTNAAGQTCEVTVTRNTDGSITAAGAGSSASTKTGLGSGSISSHSSAGGSSVHVQAGGGSVSSSSSTAGGGSAASTITVNGCMISTSSP